MVPKLQKNKKWEKHHDADSQKTQVTFESSLSRIGRSRIQTANPIPRRWVTSVLGAVMRTQQV
jgi:hypothetical protein